MSRFVKRSHLMLLALAAAPGILLSGEITDRENTSPPTTRSSAATQSTPTEPIELPSITVTAPARADTPTSPSLAEAAQQRKQEIGAYTLQDPAEMRRGRASNFEDLMRGVPGLTLQSDNEAEVSKISVRGSGVLSEDEPLGVNFLLDGFTYNQGDGEVILEDFDVGTLKYAQVYRGAAGFKYGAITLGGAINLVSDTGYDADPFALRIEGGSYGYVRTQISSGAVEGAADYYVSMMARHRDGYRDHSRENTQLFFGNFGYQLAEHLENRLYLTVDETDRQLPGGLTKAQMNANPRQAQPFAIAQNWDKQWEYVRIADKLSFKNATDTADAGAYWWHRNLQNRGFYSSDFPEGIDAFYANNYGLLLNYSHAGGIDGRKNIFTAGFAPALEQQIDQNFQNLDGTRGATTAHHSELSINAPLYAEDQQYLTDHLSLVFGLQGIYAQRQFHRLAPDLGATDDSDDLHFYGLNPKAGIIYDLDKQSQLFANISRSWQPPSFDNMLDFGDEARPTLDFTPLQPQHAWTLELGTRGTHGRFEWDAAVYRSWVRDELLELNDAQGNDRGAVNIDRSTHQGIELGIDTELLSSFLVKGISKVPGDRLTLSQTYTFNDLRFDSDPVYHNNRIAGIPIHVYEAELLYQTGNFYAGPNVQWSMTRYPVDQANTLNADPYFLLGFKIGYAFPNGMSVFLEAKNLTDQRYASSVDPIPDAQTGAPPQVFHPGDGRSFYGGLSWSF